MHSTAAARAVGGSYSRWTTPASSMREAIIAARMADGVFPAISTNRTITGRHRKIARSFRRPHKISSRAQRMETCRPDTATTWRTPVRFRATFRLSGTSMVSPSSKPRAKGAVSEGKTSSSRSRMVLRSRVCSGTAAAGPSVRPPTGETVKNSPRPA